MSFSESGLKKEWTKNIVYFLCLRWIIQLMCVPGNVFRMKQSIVLVIDGLCLYLLVCWGNVSGIVMRGNKYPGCAQWALYVKQHQTHVVCCLFESYHPLGIACKYCFFKWALKKNITSYHIFNPSLILLSRHAKWEIHYENFKSGILEILLLIRQNFIKKRIIQC